MPQEIILRVGDTIGYPKGQKGLIEKIRIISSGKCVEEYVYKGNGKNLVLTLKDGRSTTNLWVKDTPIYKIAERQ